MQQLGMKRAALAAAISAFALGLGVLPAAAVDVTITDAKVAGGKLVITGATATANMQLELDGGAFTVKSNAQKAFTFNVVYLPTDCIVEVNKVGVAQTAKAVVANCGPGGLHPKGAWKAATKYIEDDIVTSLGSSWRARQTSTNKTPSTNAGFWEKFVAKGDEGIRGATGAAGAAGATGSAGAVGATGATGPQGPIGPLGPQGPAGSQGLAGVQGPAGPGMSTVENGSCNGTCVVGCSNDKKPLSVNLAYTNNGVTVASSEAPNMLHGWYGFAPSLGNLAVTLFCVAQ